MMFPKHTEGAPGPSQLGTGGTDLAHVTMDATTGNQCLYDGEGRICAVKSEPVPGCPSPKFHPGTKWTRFLILRLLLS